MTRTEAGGAGSSGAKDSVWGEVLAIGALGFAIVVLIAISLASVGGPYVMTTADGQEVPVRVVASPGG